MYWLIILGVMLLLVVSLKLRSNIISSRHSQSKSNIISHFIDLGEFIWEDESQNLSFETYEYAYNFLRVSRRYSICSAPMEISYMYFLDKSNRKVEKFEKGVTYKLVVVPPKTITTQYGQTIEQYIKGEEFVILYQLICEKRVAYLQSSESENIYYLQI